MKKYIVLISILLLNISCIKNNNSSTSSIATAIDGKVYYYKFCGSDFHNKYICKFQCNDNTELSKLDIQNINEECKTFIAGMDTARKGDFTQEIQDNIIDPILNVNTLNIISTDYDTFKKFNDLAFVEKDKNFVKWCTSQCITDSTEDTSNIETGAIFSVWKKLQENSNTIYEHSEDTLIKSIQWTRLLGKSLKDSPTKMTYEKAKKVCEEYNFKYNDWSLPDEKSLEQAINLKLADEFNRTIKNIKITKNDFVWTRENKIMQLLVPFGKRKPEYKEVLDDTETHYVICSRKI